MATAKQRAAARRNIKKAQAAIRRKFGRHGGRRSSSSGGSSAGETKEPGAGAAYLNAQLIQRVASPLIAQGTTAISSKALPSGTALVSNLKTAALNVGYAQNLAIAAGDRWLDKKTGQAAALTRGSVTALAPEVYDAIATIADIRETKNLDEVHTRYTIRQTGYDPKHGGTNLDHGFLTKRLLKHGGQALRMFANRTSIGARLTAPIKKGLSALGVHA